LVGLNFNNLIIIARAGEYQKQMNFYMFCVVMQFSFLDLVELIFIHYVVRQILKDFLSLKWITESKSLATYGLGQCFLTAGPRPGSGPWHQLYRAARGSPGICHFSFLRNFHE